MKQQNTFSFQEVTSLTEICLEGWDDLVGDFDLYLSTPWLSVEEQISSISPIYLLGKKGTRLLAGLVTYYLGSDTPAWPFARIDAFIMRLLESAGQPISEAEKQLLSKTLPTLLCGSRRSGLSRLLIAPELDSPSQNTMIKEALVRLEKHGMESKAASLSFLYIDENDHVFRENLLEQGYSEFPAAIACRMHVPPDFASYLARFKPHHRSTLKREYQKIKDANIEFRVMSLTEEVIQKILPLEIALYDKYHSEFPPEEAAKLHSAVSQLLGDRVQVLVALHENIVRGFVVFVRWQNTLYARQGGFDYTFQGKLPLYFGLVFYAAIEYANTVGAEFIEYGVGSERAKELRGCELRQQYAYVKIFDEDVHRKVNQIIEKL